MRRYRALSSQIFDCTNFLLGFRGKEISEVLEYLLDQVMEEKIHNRREDLILAAEEYRKKSRS